MKKFGVFMNYDYLCNKQPNTINNNTKFVC